MMQIFLEVGTIDDVLIVDTQIPEFETHITRQKIEVRISNKQNLILIAKAGDIPIAYKIGYEISKTEFYSWLGGVVPAYRKQGVATKLREKQESWALNSGYTEISIKSMNRYPAMLQLLISSGFQLSGYEDNGNPLVSKICFVKTLDKVNKDTH